MWTYTLPVVALFVALAIAMEYGARAERMTPVELTDALHSATIDALANEELGRPIVAPPDADDVRAYRLANGHYLVCGRALSVYPSEMTGFSVQVVKTDLGEAIPQQTYIDRKADRLCQSGRIPLLSIGYPRS